MPPAIPVEDRKDVNMIWESHEDRLQRVESGVQTCSMQIQDVSNRVGSLHEKITEGLASISQKLGALQSVQPQIDRLNKDLTSREKRIRMSKRVTVGTAGIIATAAVTKFSDVIWAFLTHTGR